MQIKTAMSHYTLTKIAKVKMAKNTKYWQTYVITRTHILLVKV